MRSDAVGKNLAIVPDPLAAILEQRNMGECSP